MMRSTGLVLLILLLGHLHSAGQNPMHVKQYNFTTFDSIPAPKVTQELKELTSERNYSHPEFGRAPYNAQCKNCSEILDKRTVDSRYFIEDGHKGRSFFVQQSYFPLHYADKGILKTIDPRLFPDKGKSGFYAAANQPVPTYFDKNKYQTGMQVMGGEFAFNGDLKMYFEDAAGNTYQVKKANTTQTSVGSGGAYTTDAWKNIDIEQIFKQSTVKTTFVINERLVSPISDGWLVIEDEVSLPGGYTLNFDKYAASPARKKGLVVTANGVDVVNIKPVVSFDARSFRCPSFYEIANNGQTATIKIKVPVSALQDTIYKFPLFIDPEVVGKADTGHYTSTLGVSGQLQFTLGPQSCDYPMTDTVPGQSELTDTYLQLEYENNRVDACNDFGRATPFCEFNDVTMEVAGPCGNTTGQLACNPAAPPFIGTCTTDRNLVPAADSIRIPNFLPCYPPQCQDYILNFTLKNRQFGCAGNCGFECAEGKYFAVTVKGRLLEDTITFVRRIDGQLQDESILSDTTVCAGQPVTLVARPNWGVPPYTYLWSDGQTDSIITVYPEVSNFYSCTTSGECDQVITNTVTINVIPSPAAIPPILIPFCDGEAVSQTIPRTPVTGVTYSWAADPPSALTFLSSTSISNPDLNIPAGSGNDITYMITADDGTCIRVDTVKVIKNLVPNPVIQPTDVYICEGTPATLSTTETYDSYLWSTSATTATIDVTVTGTYGVTVTEEGCTATATPVNATVVPRPQFDIEAVPDNSLTLGESVTLNATIDLTAASIQSYIWSPAGTLSCTDCPEPVASPQDDQVYYLSVTSQDCEATDSIAINVIFPNNYWIPNAFTPNKDKRNDGFFIKKESGVTVLEFKVFNRWGEKVHDALTPWFGDFKNEQADMGVYTYYFKLSFKGGGEEVVKGNVTLLR